MERREPLVFIIEVSGLWSSCGPQIDAQVIHREFAYESTLGHPFSRPRRNKAAITVAVRDSATMLFAQRHPEHALASHCHPQEEDLSSSPP